jgi:hypothetical protein
MAGRLEGMMIKQAAGENGMVVSVLVGELADQSALAGVLYTLYELQKTLITVEKIPPDDLPGQLA